MKIPFNVKYRPQIESGEYKVETKDHHFVRIICWNKNTGGLDRIVALVAGDSGQEKTLHYTEEGWCCATGNNRDKDLLIVTPEPEMSEMEISLLSWLSDDTCGEIPMERMKQVVKARAAELLALAEKEIAKRHEHDVYIPEDTYYEQLKKQWEDGYDKGKAGALRTRATELTENLAKSGLDKDSIPYHLIEFMCNLYTCQNWKEIKEIAEAYTTRVKAAALKDLPRWKISLPEPGKRYVLLFNGGSIVESRDYRRGNFYYEDGEQYKNIEYNPKCVRWMYAEELYQLPGGFKED